MSCKNCKERHECCWDDCEKYKRDKEERERIKKKKKYESLQGSNESWSYSQGTRSKWIKYYGRTK